MPTSLFQLSRKKFLRAPQLEAKLAIKLLMGFIVLYFGGSLLVAGIAVYPILSDQFPERDPISVINSVLVLIFILELIIRYFLQQLPVTEIKSFLLLSIPKKRIIRNVLFRSLLSVYNAIPVLFYLPISISMLQDDYALGQVIAWWVAVTAFSLCLNFISFLANKNNKALAGFVILIILLYLSESYMDVETLRAVGYFFDAILTQPLWILVPLGVFVLLYQITFSFLKKNLNLEGSLAAKKEVANAGRYDFLDVFGSHAFFLKNDLRLIVRNVRPKNIVMMSFLSLFYGLFFFTQDSQPESLLVFASVFISGGFLLTYGNYVPAWDSEYYAFLMCQNLSYKKYLDSKWRLMTFAIIFSTVLSLPYLYFGVKIYLMILSGAAFNIGLGTWITLYGGLLNKQPLKLNVKAKAFENTQAFSGKMMLMIFPKMVLPVLLYIIPATLFNPTAGYITLAASGVLGIVFKNQILTQMVKLFAKQKHEMLQAFTQK
ncbi:MAG: hypothetical protein DA394_05075 [Candidatus Arcticimaribacter sp.]|nr:MAG: hypothetical protein DA394_05075 [Candidatus Arcticimaribacter sp.]